MKECAYQEYLTIFSILVTKILMIPVEILFMMSVIDSAHCNFFILVEHSGLF